MFRTRGGTRSVTAKLLHSLVMKSVALVRPVWLDYSGVSCKGAAKGP